jgi:hypothetical protein
VLNFVVASEQGANDEPRCASAAQRVAELLEVPLVTRAQAVVV